MGLKQQFKKLLMLAFIVVFSTSVLKTVSLFFLNSASLFSDLIFSWIVAFSQGLLYFGIGNRQVPRSRENPFGYTGRLYFFSYIATVVLFSCGALYTVMIGIQTIRLPLPIQEMPAWIPVLFYTTFIPVFLVTFRVYHFCTRLRGALKMLSFIRKSKWVDLIALLFQMTALLVTMIFSGVSLIIKHASSWKSAEGTAAVVIGLVMMTAVMAIGMKMQNLLIGDSAEISVNKRIYSMLRDEEWIDEVTSLQTLQLDSESILLAVKARFNEHLSSSELSTLITGMEMDIRQKFPDIKHIFFEVAPNNVHL